MKLRTKTDKGFPDEMEELQRSFSSSTELVFKKKKPIGASFVTSCPALQVTNISECGF